MCLWEAFLKCFPQKRRPTLKVIYMVITPMWSSPDTYLGSSTPWYSIKMCNYHVYPKLGKSTTEYQELPYPLSNCIKTDFPDKWRAATSKRILLWSHEKCPNPCVLLDVLPFVNNRINCCVQVFLLGCLMHVFRCFCLLCTFTFNILWFLLDIGGYKRSWNTARNMEVFPSLQHLGAPWAD